MKTTVSLPDELFKRAEIAAKTMKISRSELYARALREYLRTPDSDEEITRKINEFYAEQPAQVDEVLHQAQLRVLRRSEW